MYIKKQTENPLIFYRYSTVFLLPTISMAVTITHCATIRQVAGSIPDFTDIILPCSTVTLGSTQPLTEMSTRNISWVVKAAGE
jgi:hypothetical protein